MARNLAKPALQKEMAKVTADAKFKDELAAIEKCVFVSAKSDTSAHTKFYPK